MNALRKAVPGVPQFDEYFAELVQEMKEKQIDNVRTERQEAVGELLDNQKEFEILDQLESRHNGRPYSRYMALTNAIIGWWYLVIAPKRFESWNIEIDNRAAPNHLYFDGDKMVVVLQEHKTDGTVGSYELEYTDNLDILRRLLQKRAKINPDQNYLFDRMHADGTFSPWSSKDNFRKYVGRLFKSIDNKINLQTIRTVRESQLHENPDYHKLTNRQQEKLHKQFLHSKNTAQSHYNKVRKPPSPESSPERMPPVPVPHPKPVYRSVMDFHGFMIGLFFLPKKLVLKSFLDWYFWLVHSARQLWVVFWNWIVVWVCRHFSRHVWFCWKNPWCVCFGHLGYVLN